MTHCVRTCFVIALCSSLAGNAWSQELSAPPKLDDEAAQQLNIFQKPTDGENAFTLDGDSDPSLRVTLEPKDGLQTGDEVTLKLKVTIPPGWYTYSQDPGFSGNTKIKLSGSQGVVPLGEGFVPDREPKRVFESVLEQDIEKYFGEVTWSRKYRILPGASKVSLTGSIDYQTCKEQCIPHEEKFSVSADVEPSAAPPAFASYSLHGRPRSGDKRGPAEVTVKLSPADARPGETVTLTVRMKLDDGWHVYAQTQEEGPGGTPTVFNLESFQGLAALDEGFQADRGYEVKTNKLTESLTVEQHLFHDEVAWSRTFEVTEDAAADGYGIQGELQYQVCTETKCLAPQQVPFALGELSAARPGRELAVAEPAFDPDSIQVEQEESGLGLFLVYAFLGGLILNIMPCVLPVLAIKILSFVKQAGESRARIFQLNVAYSVGVVAVFLCLATLAKSLELGWGGLFQLPEFNLFMACLVFVMGLSLLGVFEIPIPGLAGSGGQKEGLAGAFLTGIFATFLATPCSGPLMGATLGWSVRQPTHIIYLVWGTMGLGMASPYLLAGMFPSAVRWLPKPGTWMVRFKELSGFALMGAVIWIISYTDTYLIVPTLIMMMGLALGLWMVGNLYDSTTHITHKTTVRVVAALSTGLIVYFGISQIPSFETSAGPVAERETDTQPSGGTQAVSSASEDDAGNQKTPLRFHGENVLPWKTFTEESLTQALRQKKTVLVDFTADWCLVCKKNEKLALNTSRTLALVREHGVVPLYADFTDKDPFLKEWLKRFESISVPLTVIFPGDNPEKPIVLRDSFSQSELIEKLEQATGSAKTAMNQRAARE